MKLLITAFTSLLPDSGVPEEIVFLPEGSHKITPQSHPKGVMVNIPADRGEAIAATLQKDLDRRLKANVGPWLDFEHTRKYPASGYPTSFRYEAGKGVMMAVNWSGSGRSAIEARDVRYFSPEVYLDKQGVPNGLPERGPLGALVTEPAFREIPPVAASDAADSEEPTNQPKIMKLLLAALNINPDAADAESAGVAAVTALKATAARVTVLETENTTLKGQVTAAENTLKADRKAQGEALFERAVAAGLIKDDEKDSAKAEYIQASESGNALAVKLLGERVTAAEAAKKPETKGQPSHLSRPIVASRAEDASSATGEHDFEKKAKALVTAKQATDIDEAYGMVAASEPALYGDYLKNHLVGAA